MKNSFFILLLLSIVPAVPAANAQSLSPIDHPSFHHVDPNAPSDLAVDAQLHGVRILLVDDEPDAREVMASAMSAGVPSDDAAGRGIDCDPLPGHAAVIRRDTAALVR